uniref:DNA endonuclease RBBP8-like n=1 Tax=Monopterus albus TaxID=43700 RepID=UPI0009B45658
RECDQCAILEESKKNKQDQNLCLIAKLEKERNSLEDENRKLHAELQKFKMYCSQCQRASTPEDKDGFIPDSPVLPSSLPMANKLKKRKLNKNKHVYYAELPLPPPSNNLLLNVPVEASKNPGGVLVPNTCELDTCQISKDVNHDLVEVIAETCGLEHLDKHQTAKTTSGQQSSSKSIWRNDILLKPHRSSLSSMLIRSPDSTTEKSPSLLPQTKRLSEDGSIIKVKWKKEEPEMQKNSKQEFQEWSTTQKPIPSQQIEQISGDQSLKQSLDSKTESAQKAADDAEEKNKVASMWSVDPALTLSTYDSEQSGDEQKEEKHHGELGDTDCTWVSHSLLQGRGDASGLG